MSIAVSVEHRIQRVDVSDETITAYLVDGRVISVPLAWDELRPTLDPQSLTMITVPTRLQRLRRDPWEEYWKARQKLTAQRIKAISSA